MDYVGFHFRRAPKIGLRIYGKSKRGYTRARGSGVAGGGAARELCNELSRHFPHARGIPFPGGEVYAFVKLS